MAAKRYKKTRLIFCLFVMTIALLVSTSNIFAEMASMADARQAGENWLNYIVYQNGSWNGEISPQLMEGQEIFYENQMLGYYFPVNPSGFIVVPVLKELPPIKLYDETSSLDVTEDQGMAGLIREVLYHRITMYIKRYGDLNAVQPASGEVMLGSNHRERWTQLLKSRSEFLADLYADKMTRQTTVGPLLTSLWHQSGPYNSLCPVGDAACVTCPNGGSPSSDTAVVGCVATAASQIMNYWQWPPAGVGNHSYAWDGDQSCSGDVGATTLSADFSDSYDWNNILDNYGGSPTQTQIDAVAELCYEVAVAFNMDFGVCGSGAATSDAVYVYPTYFRYNAATIDKEDRDAHTPEEWFSIIQFEIDASQPIQYRISGHSIVCDGWKDTGPEDEIHMNYGWGGGANAWYTIDNLHCDWEGCDPMVEYLIRGIVPDNLPPVAECEDVTVNADENCEAMADIDDGSYDPEGYALDYTQIPTPPYQLGVTHVMLIVEDPQGLTDVCYADVTVVDVTPPTAICPGDVTQANDVDECSAVVSFDNDVTDNCSGATVEAVPPSGSVFPVGTTTVTVAATDGSGNIDECEFTVAVVDTQNPVVSCPTEIEVNFITPSEATAEYQATATDNCDTDLSIWCDPSSGSTFTIGSNLVSCYAEDDAANKDTCTFTFYLAYVDIKPGSCPNAFNVNPYNHEQNELISLKAGVPLEEQDRAGDLKAPEAVLPVAILGLEDFDIREINPETILLNGIAPLRWEYQDVATPAQLENTYCGCATDHGDGFDDLTLKFASKEIVASLGDVNNGDVIQLILEGELISGIPFYGGDCLLIRGSLISEEVIDKCESDESVELLGATPNPFNPITILNFRMNKPADYKMTIYNIAGQVVEVIEGVGQTGLNQVSWDGSKYTSGVYFYRLDALGYSATKKMLLIK